VAEKYDFAIDLSADTSQTRTIKLIGPGKRVLEFGCATGYVSRILTQQFGCLVTGIERNPEAADAARRACLRVICDDAETLDYETALGEERFDVVLFADVLEHFKDPRAVLRRIRNSLVADGYVVASIPNVAHAAVALELLRGNFDYRPYGLLDDAHLRFFNRRAIYELFESAGYVVSELDRLKADLGATELSVDPGAFPPEVVRFALQQDEATTYQFVVKAYPATEVGTLHALRQQLADAGRQAGGGAAKDAELATAREVRDRLLADVQNAREVILAKDAELATAREVHDRLLAEVETASRIHEELRGQLEQFRSHLESAEARAAFLERERAALDHRLTTTETRLGWMKLGARLFLGPRSYEAVRRVYRQWGRGLRGATEKLGRGPGPGRLHSMDGHPLEDLLACPGCGHAPLGRAAAGLVCPACRANFPVVRGTPVFLVQPEDYVDRTGQEGRTNPYSSASLDIIRRFSHGVVLDLGAGHPKDEELFPNIVRQEIHHFASTHVVSNTPRLPFRDACFDAVVCESVLEHALDPWGLAQDMYRVLKPGGVVRVDSAFLYPFHGDPSHYFNMTVPGIEHIFRRFHKLRSGVDAHQAASYTVRVLLQQCHEFVRDPEIRTRMEALLAAPLERIDRELTQEQHQVVGAGVFFEGLKDPAAP
jgi:2-polyprenyl-3-methyl-5-hydroxy-6-metoxy-1,4-benzoquinol methylase/uncharacterized protein YbaR (Trm112 family)